MYYAGPDPDADLSLWQRRMVRIGLQVYQNKTIREMSDENCQAVVRKIARIFGIYYIFND